MPRTHFLCLVDGQPIPVKDCLACARTFAQRQAPDGTLKHCDFPYAGLAALAHSSDRRKGVGISVTNVTGCWRKSWAESRYDYAASPRQGWFAEDGSAYHDYLDQHTKLPEDEALTEVRLWKTLSNGLEISGQFDLWWMRRGRIEDYKTKNKHFTEKTIPEEYILQLNIYRWMLETGARYEQDGQWRDIQAEVPITELVLWPIAHGDFQPVQVPLLPHMVIEQWVLEATAGLQGEHLQDIPREYAKPGYFCDNYCAFRDACHERGGPIMPKRPIRK